MERINPSDILVRHRSIKSLDPLFLRNREILFHPVHIRHLCKILCQLMHPLNCFFGMKKIRKKFYIVIECGLDETISPSFVKTRDPDSDIKSLEYLNPNNYGK